MRPFSFFIGIVSQLVPDFWPQVPPTDPWRSGLHPDVLVAWPEKLVTFLHVGKASISYDIHHLFSATEAPYRGPSSGPMDSRKGHPREVWNVGSLIIIHTCRLRVFQWPLYHLGMYNYSCQQLDKLPTSKGEKKHQQCWENTTLQGLGPLEKTEKMGCAAGWDISQLCRAKARHTTFKAPTWVTLP